MKLRKITAIVLVLLLLAASVSTAYAADSADSIAFGEGLTGVLTVYTNNTAKYDVYAYDMDGLTSCTLGFDYEPDVFFLTSAVGNSSVSDMQFYPGKNDSGKGYSTNVFAFVNEKGLQDSAKKAVKLCTFNLQVKKSNLANDDIPVISVENNDIAGTKNTGINKTVLIKNSQITEPEKDDTPKQKLDLNSGLTGVLTISSTTATYDVYAYKLDGMTSVSLTVIFDTSVFKFMSVDYNDKVDYLSPFSGSPTEGTRNFILCFNDPGMNISNDEPVMLFSMSLEVLKDSEKPPVPTLSILDDDLNGSSNHTVNDAILYVPVAVKGDIDGDEKVTASDARLALRISAKLENVTDEVRKLADVDGDGNVTAADARKILRVAAKLESF